MTLRQYNLKCIAEPEAYGQCTVDAVHCAAAETAHALPEALLVYRPHLFQKDYGVLGQSAIVGVDLYMGRQLGFVLLARYRGGNNGRTVFVADIVLNYKYRTYSALFRADYRTEICVVYFSSFYCHFVSLSV